MGRGGTLFYQAYVISLTGLHESGTYAAGYTALLVSSLEMGRGGTLFYQAYLISLTGLHESATHAAG